MSPRIGRGEAVATEKTGRTTVTETEAVGGRAERRHSRRHGTMEIVPIGAPTRANDGAFIETPAREGVQKRLADDTTVANFSADEGWDAI